jgi:hypothetical protein
MLAKHFLIDISLISYSQLHGHNRALEYSSLSIFTQRQYQTEVTRNISTAESPGRWR